MAVKPIPEGYHTVTPYIVANDAAKLVDFLERAVDAKTNFRMDTPDGKLFHAEVQIGNSLLMLGSSMPQHSANKPMLYIYVPDVDAAYKKAIDAGAKAIREPKDEFYGDRAGAFADTEGNPWWVATHIEDVAPDELKRRGAEFLSKDKQQGASAT